MSITKNLCFPFHVFFPSSFIFISPKSPAGASFSCWHVLIFCFRSTFLFLSSSLITFSQCVSIFLQDKEKHQRADRQKKFSTRILRYSTQWIQYKLPLSVDHLNIRQCALAPCNSYRPVRCEYSCVCVGHEGRPRAAGPMATRVTYTHAATRNNHLSSI